MECASFWLRFVAYFVDTIVVSVGWVILFLLFLLFGVEGVEDATMAIVGFFGVWLYNALFESSARQATPGKMALRLIVTDLNGGRISFGRASGRFFGKIVSSLFFYMGFLVALFTKRKQALHDILAGTLVIPK